MKRSFLLLVCLAAVTFVGARISRGQSDVISADSLLKQMEAAYAAAKSYRDTISVRFRNPDGGEGAQAECKVWFVRPDDFRIDGQSRRAPDAPPKREVIWANAATARSWSTTNPVTMRSKVQLAGSKMFGTYAYHIPTLLEASYGGPHRLHQLEQPTLVGEENFEGVECYRIRGDWQGDPYEVWLGKTDFLVRKITAYYKGYGMEEIHRDIAINEVISKETFEFAPENEAAPQKTKASK